MPQRPGHRLTASLQVGTLCLQASASWEMVVWGPGIGLHIAKSLLYTYRDKELDRMFPGLVEEKVTIYDGSQHFKTLPLETLSEAITEIVI